MKAAMNLREYLRSLQDSSAPYAEKELDQILASRSEARAALKRAEEKNGDMLLDLHAALWPDKPVHLHSFEHMLTTIRNRRVFPDSALQLERSERERLASQLREAEKECEERLKDAEFTERKYNTLRQALREVCEAVLPAYKDKDPGQQLSALQTTISEAQKAARKATEEFTPKYTENSLGIQVAALHDQLHRERKAVESAREQRTEANDELHTVKGINRGMTTALDETFAAIKNLYQELGGSPGSLPINDGPGMLNYLSVRIKQRERDAAEPAIAAKVNQALTGVQSKLRDTMAERDEAQRKLRVLQRRLRDLLPEESPGDFIDWSNE